MKQYQVKNINSGVIFTVNEGESVLTAALRQGVMLPYSCKNGTCGSCKGQLESGEVHYPFHPPLALSREEIGEGQCPVVPGGADREPRYSCPGDRGRSRYPYPQNAGSRYRKDTAVT